MAMGTQGRACLDMYERCSIGVKIRILDDWGVDSDGVVGMRSFTESSRETVSLFLIATLICAFSSPVALSENSLGAEDESIILADLSEFKPPIEGKRYLFNEIDEPIFSATSFLKKQWIEDGYPGLVLPFSPSYQLSKHSTRSCENSWSVGESDNITTTDETITATVQRISANTAIFVEDGEIVSSTTLNDIASTWESIIYPTDTNYFGDVPDVDNNCQIEIVIHPVDGIGGTGGYFQPGLSSLRESIFVDIDDLSGRNAILSYELEHLIHNAWDPYEFIWIDEGAAAMATYLCFGSNAELNDDANAWSINSSTSLRWWNERDSDHGASFLFMLYLADKLGGAPSIRSLVSDTSLGGSGIENLARSPGPGSTPIGETMSEIFANFSAAVTLDSSQGTFGFSNLELADGCSSSSICKVSASGSNGQWSELWQSPGNTVEGWGLRSFRFTQGTGEPLNLMFQPDRFGFEGVVLIREAATGTWTMEKVRIDASTGVGTSLIHGFGNSTAEVWLLTWYNSLVDDCDFDFANCGILSGGSYPSGSITVNAGLISEPAEVSISSTRAFDRDGDSLDDSIEFGIDVVSSAYFETLEVIFEAYTNNSLVDSTLFNINAGNSEPVSRAVWFTPHLSADWSFAVRIKDITGELQDEAFTLPIQIYNMKPVAAGSISAAATQTWLPVFIFGGGYDNWGFGLENGSFSHNETPASYIWDLGDGYVSSLKNPMHPYTDEGVFFITLVVMDQGGHYSDSSTWNISVNDSSSPVPQITIDGLIIMEDVTIQTNQRIHFSAYGTTDNVPVEQLTFTWDWGDGVVDSGVGLFEMSHSWADGSSDGTAYPMRVTISDGNHVSEQEIVVRVLNRVPREIHEGSLQTHALIPLRMPDIFVDEDGAIVEYRWSFDEGVNLGGGGLSLSSDFLETSAFVSNPIIGWREPGLKNVTLEVKDDDGNSSSIYLEVEVLNQRPVAIFNRPSDGQVGSAFVFESESFDPDGDSSALSHRWTLSDMEFAIENTSSVSRSFLTPGLYSVSLVVIDERNLESVPKTFLFSIENPLPIPVISFSTPSYGGAVLEDVPEDGLAIVWQVPMTEDGGAFVAPGHVIRFDGSSSHDADPRFDGKSSTDQMSPSWGGVVSWIWDFGDASPAKTGPIVWHEYERPGTYDVRLTVIDGFSDGESNTTEMTVIVSAAPEILTLNPINSEYVVVGDPVSLFGNATDLDLDSGEWAWMDLNALSDSDGDGDPANDKDRNLTGMLEFYWDLNVFEDGDCLTLDGCDGDPRNDWIDSNMTWRTPGEVRISMTVCDGVGVCSSRDYVISVLSLQDTAPPKTLSDLTLSDLTPDRSSAGLLALVSVVAILGWMIMRQKDEEEMEAMDMVERYGVEQVEAEGGLPGMDQHAPPPQPTYLTAEERTNMESGYVRPIRTRRK